MRYKQSAAVVCSECGPCSAGGCQCGCLERQLAQLAALGFAYGGPSLEPGPAECHWRELPGGALAVYTLYTHPGEHPCGSLTLYRNRAAYVESGVGAWLASGESAPVELLGECHAGPNAAGWLVVAVAQLAALAELAVACPHWSPAERERYLARRAELS